MHTEWNKQTKKKPIEIFEQIIFSIWSLLKVKQGENNDEVLLQCFFFVVGGRSFGLLHTISVLTKSTLYVWADEFSF